MNHFLYTILVIFFGLSTACYAEESRQEISTTSSAGSQEVNTLAEAPLIPLSLSSAAFKNEETIPMKYTCDGQNISPPLSINGVNKKTKSLVLFAVDRESSSPPDQSVIWLLYNISPNAKQIEEDKLPPNVATGRNTDGSHSYQGPCPKDVGEHRYYFNLYALDIALPETVVNLKDAAELMNEHVVGFASLMGTYIKK